ncbi:MAG: hypothetical protein KF902_08520 [Phycisphaeraceae bacterium]|nr:hypothetical protein [Phycisphaeraceae bacterium]MCW5767306.1 hypothetical protein [Phycisphaeraceae bacterium]
MTTELAAESPVRVPKQRSFPSRFHAALAWVLPLAILTLVPKCPACIAAYVLVLTGVGMSLPSAGTLRLTLISLSVIVIIWLLASTTRSAIRGRLSPP